MTKRAYDTIPPPAGVDPLLVINKTDLAPHVGASLEVMARDSEKMRGALPFVFCALKENKGVDQVLDFIKDAGGLG